MTVVWISAFIVFFYFFVGVGVTCMVDGAFGVNRMIRLLCFLMWPIPFAIMALTLPFYAFYKLIIE